MHLIINSRKTQRVIESLCNEPFGQATEHRGALEFI